MSFFDDASLVTIPSGVKDGVLYSVKPIDGSGDLTFSRGSDIEATRVNANGYIEKAQVNLLLQSNSFDTTWFNILTTSTSGQTGYDGSSNAWLLSKSAAGGNINQTGLSVSGLQTFSLYAKAGTSTWISMTILGGLNPRTSFDLVNGVVGTLLGGAVSAKIESVGNGYYRCSIVGNVTATGVYIYPSEGDGDTSGTSGNIYIQDAQLNYGLVAQTYQETTTAAVVSGITNDMPRLSYDPANPTCPSLLLEPSRSNIIADSEFFNNTSVWTQNPQITIDDNQDTSPEGVLNAARIYNNSGSDTTIFYGASVNVGSAGTYTFSIFAKKGGLGWIRLRCLGFDAAANNNCYFDLENGVKGTNTFDEANIEDYGGGWYRCSVKFTTSTDLTGTCYVYGSDGDNDTTVASGASYYLSVYGAQLEAGSYPTSYIPTYGSSATRTADAASKTGISSLIGQTEGTLFLEFNSSNVAGSYNSIFGISNGTTASRVLIYFSSNRIDAQVRDASVTQASFVGVTMAANTTYKCAIAYKANDVAFYVNGTQIGLDTSATIPAMSDVRFDSGGGATPCDVPVSQALVFKTRLSNADLATLTTL